VTVLEFWPDYGPGPLWTQDGQPVDLASLGLGRRLTEEVEAWHAGYTEDKVPCEGPGDRVWLSQGKGLLGQIRAELGDHYQVAVTEPWWDEEPT